ncbi:MAG: family transposase [Gammaproteobacteria bacterium]|nr:family transposase [Gammaproteobacteria bacterium]
MKRELVEHLQQVFAVSLTRSCHAMGIKRSVYYYRSKRYDQASLRARIQEIAHARVRYGYMRIYILLRREGWQVNHKRIHRLYKLEGLNLRRKMRRHKSSTARAFRDLPTQINQVWSMDFVYDELFNGQRLRFLTVVDIFTRECLKIAAGHRLTAEDVVEAMNQITENRSYPQQIFVDNGSEFASRLLDHWAYQHQVTLAFSRPGKPTDNAFIESFNGSFRDECLNVHWFLSLEDAKIKVENWREDYNLNRPHSGLNYLPPASSR